jgi:hypothetical protein
MLDFGQIVADSLKEYMDNVLLEVVKELEGQGHRASGKLIDTARVEIEKRQNEVAGFLFMENYYKFVDSGFKPRLSRAYIDALVKWMELPSIGIGSSDKERRGIAFAIYHVASQTGHPTPGSFAFSNNGRRKDFIAETILPASKRINEVVSFGKVREYFIQQVARVSTGNI